MPRFPQFMTAASIAAALLSASSAIAAGPNDLAEPARVLEPRLFHLLNHPAREWSSCPEQPEAEHLEVRFTGIEKQG